MSVIADLIRAGVDPELVGRVVEWHEAGLKELASGNVRGQNAELERRKALDAQRKRLKRKAQMSGDASADKKGSDGSPNDNTLTPSLPPKTKPTLRSGLERARARTSVDAGPISFVSFDLDFARQQGLDEQQTAREFDQFLDHHRKNGSLMADWHAAWRTWVRNVIKFQARAGPAGRSNGTQGFLEAVARDIENDRRRREAGTSQTVLSLPEFRQ